MNKIIFPLKPGILRPVVADFQETLRLCLDRGAIQTNDEGARQELPAALKPEGEGQTYGDVTSKLVSIFQEERHVQSSGEVDEATVNALNALLKEWGCSINQQNRRSRGRSSSATRYGVRTACHCRACGCAPCMRPMRVLSVWAKIPSTLKDATPSATNCFRGG